jgi:hypothetical protein
VTLFQAENIEARLGEPPRGDAAGRASTNDEHVGVFHPHPPESSSQPWIP